MLVNFLRVLAVAIMIPTLGRAEVKGRDYVPFSALDGFVIAKYNDIKFDSFNFLTDDTGKTIRVEGHLIKILYDVEDNNKGVLIGSGLLLVRTIEDQAKSLSGQVLYSAPDDIRCHGPSPLTYNTDENAENHPSITIRAERGNSPIWIAVKCYDPRIPVYEIDVLEERPFKLSANVPASELRTEIDSKGKAIIHVNFDFNRATLRADAQPLIQEIVGIMKADPDLKLEVDGHTDGIGSDSYNQSLSEDRAKTVVASIVASGIDTGRVTSAGFGASKPISDNTTAQGRADNRRVELIKR